MAQHTTDLQENTAPSQRQSTDKNLKNTGPYNIANSPSGDLRQYRQQIAQSASTTTSNNYVRPTAVCFTLPAHTVTQITQPTPNTQSSAGFDRTNKDWIVLSPGIRARLVEGRIEAQISITPEQANGEMSYSFNRADRSKPHSAECKASLKNVSQQAIYNNDLEITETTNGTNHGLSIKALNNTVDNITVKLTATDGTQKDFVISREMLQNPVFQQLPLNIPSEGRQATATLVGDEIILFTGGHTTPAFKDESPKTAKAFLIDVSGDTPRCREIQSMHAQRWGHRATTLKDGTVFICGGGPDKTCEIYNPKTESFSLAGELNHPRSGHEQELLPNGRVLIVGGYAKEPGKTGALKSLEIFDPATNTSAYNANLAFARAGHSVVSVGDKTFILGGTKESLKVEVWNSSENRLEASSLEMPAHLKDFRTHVLGDNIYIVGGTDLSTGKSSDLIYKLNTINGRIESFKNKLSVAREDITLVASKDGKRLLAVGGEIKNKGQPNDGAKTDAVETINLVTQEVTIAQVTMARDDSRSVSIGGMHYIVGGVKGREDNFARNVDTISNF